MPVTMYSLYQFEPETLNGVRLPHITGPENGFWELTVPREGHDEVRPGEPAFRVENALDGTVPMGADAEFKISLDPERFPLDMPLQLLLYNIVAVLVSDGTVLGSYDVQVPAPPPQDTTGGARSERSPEKRVTLYNLTWESDPQLELNGRRLPRFEPGPQFGWLEFDRSESSFPDQSTLYDSGPDTYKYDIDLTQLDGPDDSFALYLMQGLLLVGNLYEPNTSQLLIGDIGG